MGLPLVTEDETLSFIDARIKSVWSLELLLLLFREPARAWRRDELARELRGSEVVVQEALGSLYKAGLVIEDQPGIVRFGPASDHLRDMVASVDRIYTVRPMAIIKAITGSPNDRLRIFSDAFKFREK